MTKAVLRIQYLAQQKSLTPAQVQQGSEALCAVFFRDFKLEGVKYLHLFLPARRHNEIDTWLIVNRLRNEFPEIVLVVPKVDAETNMLQHFIFSLETALVLSKWGIPEPAGGEQVRADKIDLVLVPLLCADARGYRVGYGKGFYDRFLATCRADVIKIGLSYFPPVPEIEDVDAWDVKLDELRWWAEKKTEPDTKA